MTGRLQLIEQKLIAIDSARFQNLCDTYLYLREKDFSSFNRTGSQLGKQKTVPGTPDTFFRLSNGTLGYVEYTTQAESLIKKIKEDIDKCLDESKTGVPANEVRKVTVCFNSRLEPAEETEIYKYAKSKGIGLELIGIDSLAIEICSSYLLLAKEFLEISLDTGQVLPYQKFIEEYNNKAGKLATPIDNLFLHRVTELGQIENYLEESDIVIIAGHPGVGKTKLGVETIERFCKANTSYEPYAIAKKDVDIHDDLRILIKPGNDYVILVDDANRQLPSLQQILGVLNESRKGNLKLILTVRNYAYEDIASLCQDYSVETIEVKKFTDEEISEIISSDSFEVRNSKFQRKIIEISDGNARLAVMAAKLAREQEHEFLWGDVSDLYDSYFDRFLKDFDLDGNKKLLKTLGVISFFFSINRNDKEFVNRLLEVFNLDYYEFNEAIDELHKRELVEVQYDIVRVSEQILSTYIFYKVFIKDQILSYRSLLDNYFPKWMPRFRDTIIPSNNSFGYENVLGKVDGILNDYLATIYSDEKQVLEFFSLFWFYKPTETLTYFHDQIKNLPEPKEPVYDTDYESNKLAFNRNKTLEFLVNFFHHNTDNLKPAIELAFEYCRKSPKDLPDLIKHIREKFPFDVDDERVGFARQVVLFELLREKFKNGEGHYISAYFALSKTFISRHFQITKGGRKHTITFYDYNLPFNRTIQEFRKDQWQFLFDNFESYPNEILEVLKSFGPHFRDNPDEENKLLAYDLSLLLPFIDERLDSKVFKHIHYVHGLVSWLNKEKLLDRSYQKLKSSFYSKEYEDFLKIDWDRLRDKESYEFDDYKEYESLKTADLRHSFVFHNENEFERLTKAVGSILSNKDNLYHLSQSLDIIVEENFLRNDKIGFALLLTLMKDYPSTTGPLFRSIKAISSSLNYSRQFFQILCGWENKSNINWLMTYFESVPESLIDETLTTELLEVIDQIDSDCYIWFEAFEKFEQVDKQIFEKVLQSVVTKVETEKLRIRLSHNFFEKYINKFSGNFELLASAYIQQDNLDNHFDFSRSGLKQMIALNPEFLLAYVIKTYSERNEIRRDTHNHLNFVWDMELSDELIEKAIDHTILGNFYFGVGDHAVNIFFNDLNESQFKKAKDFILSYISKHSNDEERMNAIFDAIRHNMRAFHEEAFLRFLSKNHDVEFFKKIWWRGNGGGVVSGEVNFGELEAGDWRRILSMVEKFNNQLDVLAIKSHVKKQISNAIRWAESERQRKFANPEWPF